MMLKKILIPLLGKKSEMQSLNVLTIDTLPDGWITHVVPLKRRKKVVQSPSQSIQAYASVCSFGFRYPGNPLLPHHQHTRHYTATTQGLVCEWCEMQSSGLPHSCQLENRVDASYCRRVIHSFFSICFFPSSCLDTF